MCAAMLARAYPGILIGGGGKMFAKIMKFRELDSYMWACTQICEPIPSIWRGSACLPVENTQILFSLTLFLGNFTSYFPQSILLYFSENSKHLD